ncbi:MAG: phosphoenolpyruvate carboxykinase (ATP) [Candidatus Omnitrophica bacterium]|nr:phosphoenolpyruvate carboxykinase (ATP) [Candidatus Omnitrophota bacterium]
MNPGLKQLGLENAGRAYWDLPVAALYEEAVRRHEGLLAQGGPLVLCTVPYTGRLPQDKFFVREPSSESKICWGEINRPFDPAKFNALKNRMLTYFQGKDIFIQNCYAGADPRYQIPIRVITQRATHALFARSMFIREPDPAKLMRLDPEFTILHAPHFHADPQIDGTHSDAFIILHLGEKLVLIGGTAYAGEIKKSVFSLMNYLLPQRGIMTMHASANYGKDENDLAIFFGLSGTGKTTLSASSDRTLIGDDEHGWSDDGVFNFEGGCYAKVIKLSREGEPEIYATTRRFGTLLENVVMDTRTREIDLNDESLTENTRATYPIFFIPNMTLTGRGGHPKNVIMLTCDAFGVFPPIARLTPDQAMYHFLAGYTAKVAGTEAGIKEPQATFSPCFGVPFMPLSPSIYAGLLGAKIAKHKVNVWMINTGWNGGPYGEGQRIKLSLTRAMVKAVLDGSLKKIETKPDPIFGIAVPVSCAGVPSEILDPRKTWKDPAAYDKKAHELVSMFKNNFEKNAADAPANIKAAGPKI